MPTELALRVAAQLVLLAAVAADAVGFVQTYPAKTSPDGRLIAFEIENVYIGAVAVARLLKQIASVTDVKRRRLFSSNGDVHVRFKHKGHSCIVWEPYGDNSRYWIGPEDPDAPTVSLQDIAKVFDAYSPPTYRVTLGNLLSMRFLK
jgi:hypothetical protein